MSVVTVDVRQELPFLECFRADRRVHYVNGDERILKRPALEKHSRKIDDPNLVRFAGGFDRPLPNTDPPDVGRQFEIREVAPDHGVLVSDA
jgi:hypothetical protein